MWIKICGNTSLEDAQMAVEYGSDALGFIFASSPRQVTKSQVRQIVSRLPAQVEKYGIFVDADFAEIVRTVTECGLSGVQLHGSSAADLSVRLREHFTRHDQKVSIVRVLRRESVPAPPRGNGQAAGGNEQADFEQELARCGSAPAIDAVLVDAFSAKVHGGSGTSFDWNAAKAGFQRAASGMRLIVAGGLRPENVGLAISTLQPWGVDVVSGVEKTPGKKDRARVQAFIQAAREAGAGFGGHPALSGFEQS